MQCRDLRGSIRPVVRALAALALIGMLAPRVASDARAASADSSRARTNAAVPPFAPPFAHLPLMPPLSLNGGFGEYRSNHFHGGLDLGTGGDVGARCWRRSRDGSSVCAPRARATAARSTCTARTGA